MKRKNSIQYFSILLLFLLMVPLFSLTAQTITGINALWGIGSGYRERSRSVIIDNNLNTILTGYTRGKPVFDISGGNFVPVNHNKPGWFLIKYNEKNVPLWGYHTNYSDYQLMITNVAAGNDNRIVLAGMYGGFNIDIDFSPAGTVYMPASANNNYSFFVAVYDSNGVFQSHNEIVALLDTVTMLWGGNTFLSDLKTDSQNNIYISGYCGDLMVTAGTTADTIFKFSYFVAKYDSNCVLQWLHHLTKEVKEFHNWTNMRPVHIDLDNADNLYVSMTFSDSLNVHFENESPQHIAALPYDYSLNPFSDESSNTDFVIIKFNGSGNYINHRHFNSPDVSRQKILDVEITENRIVMLSAFNRHLVLDNITCSSVGTDSNYDYNLVLMELDTALQLKQFQRYYNNILSPRAATNLISSDRCGNILLHCNLLEANAMPFPPFATSNYYVLSCENLYLFDRTLQMTDSIVTQLYLYGDFAYASIRDGKINLCSIFKQSHSLGNFTVYEVPPVTGQDEYDIYLAQLSYNGCSKSVSENELHFPNVFTPNGDGLNEIFKPSGFADDIRIIIYNRWGNEIFRTSDDYQWWNGKSSSGNECSEGVYFYVASYSLNGISMKANGVVMLLR